MSMAHEELEKSKLVNYNWDDRYNHLDVLYFSGEDEHWLYCRGGVFIGLDIPKEDPHIIAIENQGTDLDGVNVIFNLKDYLFQ